RALKTFLSCWLEPAHVPDFRTPPRFEELISLIDLVSLWLGVFTSVSHYLPSKDPEFSSRSPAADSITSSADITTGPVDSSSDSAKYGNRNSTNRKIPVELTTSPDSSPSPNYPMPTAQSPLIEKSCILPIGRISHPRLSSIEVENITSSDLLIGSPGRILIVHNNV
ncbi:unnamed protein product, partial [Protopolystoma xenopodis]